MKPEPSVCGPAAEPQSVSKLIDEWLAVDLSTQQPHADLGKVAEALAIWKADMPAIDPFSIDGARSEFSFTHEFWQSPKIVVNSVLDRVVRASNGLEVGIRDIVPEEGANRSGLHIAYLHGGGWMLGSPNTHDNWARTLVNGAGAPISLIDYPKAPETAFHDIIGVTAEVLLALQNDIRRQGRKMILAGDSAGATLALLVMANGRHEVQAEGLALLYGPYDPNLSLRSHMELATTSTLTRERMAWFWSNFLPEDSAWEDTFGPIASLKLPPVYLTGGSCDLLLDDTLLLARMLMQAGKDVTLKIESGMPHGFFQMTHHVEAAQHAADQLFAWISSLPSQADGRGPIPGAQSTFGDPTRDCR
ncbi:MAG: alpha/beta hydrolase fold domain-containing protein [Alphaproteobacteria bacterium]